ncbi:delta(3,5)-Delta(2,4)-dienoyl-CoA isomerase, mitochondrial-like isoform X1 [Aquila chrysaetos chrysaetos]|uniref:delta(3,5)-Delta(2,4)-dienoyl-CoA isomerase, mitochondrial-like isoform X1 n=1 Tax=Aquila chrysaetos chrysaetos TaxID=223781 RepID=UPI001B7D2AAC|nr:delta(3,5)-Delta(2,4)-dienoyl-CoA isomerase, mitochondrial-like isoform X1 [Aquila chrysaetos chrysaetos]
MLAETEEWCLPGHSFEMLRVMLEQDRILHVELHHPEKRNAMNMTFWREMVECFQDIGQDLSCHAIVISGAGKIFTAVPEASDHSSAWHLRRRSLINKLAFTTHKIMAPEAQSSSLVSRVFADKETLLQGALEVATAIAARSPVAVQGTKVNLLCSQDHPVPKSLC